MAMYANLIEFVSWELDQEQVAEARWTHPFLKFTIGNVLD